jgi:ABC-type Fe3+-siderophore transport system permease subunit
MLTEIFESVNKLTGSIFGFVSNILEFAFSLPLWFILTSNVIVAIAVVVIVFLIVRRKRNNPKVSSEYFEFSDKT